MLRHPPPPPSAPRAVHRASPGARRPPARAPRPPRAAPPPGDAPSAAAAFAARDGDLKDKVDALRTDATARFEASLARAAAAAASPSSPSSSSSSSASTVGAPPATRARLAAALATLNRGLVERETETRLLLLAALAREHILFVGPPGTAKSELARRLAALSEGPYFERLLTRFSVPEELFGPLSMRALEDDKYVRQTEGYLPTASVAFVDEVFKASSAILNSLLTLLNERAFDNGAARDPVPLTCLVGASNELPESEELDALYDRFLVRREVAQVSGEGLGALLRGAVEGSGRDGDAPASSPSSSPILTDADLAAATAGAAAVAVPDDVLALVADARAFLQDRCEPPVYVSDRRLVKALALLRVAAWADGRDAVARRDCLLLQHVLWQRPGEAARVADWVVAALADDDGVGQASYLFAGMFGRACIGASSRPASLPDVAADVASLRGVLEERLGGLQAAAAAARGGKGTNGAPPSPAAPASLWLAPADAAALDAALAPRLDAAAAAARDLLYEVAALDAALAASAEAVALADLLPRRWADFIRAGDLDDVRPLGTRASPVPSLPFAAPP